MKTETKLTQAKKIGTKIGQAMARDVIADDMPREWAGLDAQDGDQLTSAGIEPGTSEWDAAEQAAKEAMSQAIEGRGGTYSGGVLWDVAADWVNHFDDASEASAWMDVGFWDASAASLVKALGLTPEQAASRAQELIDECDDAAEIYTDGDPIYSICNGDTNADVLLGS